MLEEAEQENNKEMHWQSITLRLQMWFLSE